MRIFTFFSEKWAASLVAGTGLLAVIFLLSTSGATAQGRSSCTLLSAPIGQLEYKIDEFHSKGFEVKAMSSYEETQAGSAGIRGSFFAVVMCKR